jgi:hypothetical protein
MSGGCLTAFCALGTQYSYIPILRNANSITVNTKPRNIKYNRIEEITNDELEASFLFSYIHFTLKLIAIRNASN